MSGKTLKRADKKSGRNNKNSIYKVLAVAVIAVLLAAVMVVFGNPNEGVTSAHTTQEASSATVKDYVESMDDMFERGGTVAMLSPEALNEIGEDEEDLPNVGREAFKKLIRWCVNNSKLTSIAAAVQTVPEEAVANGDGTYSLTIPVSTLLTTGVTSVDRLALYAVLEASDEIGAKLVEVPYEPTTGKITIPLAKVLLIIDQKGDGEAETTTGSETSTATEKQRETQSAQSREKSTTVSESRSTTAEYVYSGEYYDEPETKPTEAQKTSPTEENALSGVGEESPITGGHDF